MPFRTRFASLAECGSGATLSHTMANVAGCFLHRAETIEGFPGGQTDNLKTSREIFGYVRSQTPGNLLSIPLDQSSSKFQGRAMTKTLLLVDDSRAVRLASRRMVAKFGFDVLEAENGEAALEVVRTQGPIDAVLLDWNMPVMDGITFLRELRADASLSQPKVVMCTTENDVPQIMAALAAGANEYIMKPFTEEIIRDKLEATGVL